MKAQTTFKILFSLSLSLCSFFSNALEIDDAFKKLAGVNVVTEIIQKSEDLPPVERHSYYLRNQKPNRDFKTDNLDDYFQKHLNLYLKENNYGAHFPSYEEYFSKRLGISRPKTPFREQIIVEEDGSFRQANLNPDYLYRVDYLLASKGESMMSGFGHSMIRLVFCDPARATQNGEIVKDDQCLEDQNFHMVISYRAQVNDMSISSIKGVFGGYPSRLFIIPFNQIKKEYNQTEFRDLLAFKMNLSESQKERFLKRTMELYWTYQSDYKFLSNNCAVEVMNLVRSVLWDSKISINDRMKPYSVLKELQKSKLIAGDALVFRSYEKDFKQYLSYINEVSSQSYTLEQYSELAANERAQLTKLAAEVILKNEENSKEQLKGISSLVLLEKLVSERAITKAQSTLPNLVKEGKVSTVHLKSMKDFLALVDNFNLAERNGLGIPNQEQFISIDEFTRKLDAVAGSFTDFKKFIINSIPILKLENETTTRILSDMDKIKRKIRSKK